MRLPLLLLASLLRSGRQVFAAPTGQVLAALPDDHDLACSGVKAVASLIQTKYARRYKKGLPETAKNAKRRNAAARSVLGSACKDAFEQWAIIGKNAEDESSTRRYSDFQSAMGGASCFTVRYRTLA